jgi:hypothetical protein
MILFFFHMLLVKGEVKFHIMGNEKKNCIHIMHMDDNNSMMLEKPVRFCLVTTRTGALKVIHVSKGRHFVYNITASVNNTCFQASRLGQGNFVYLQHFLL